jgi:hypothetical protein
MRLVFNRQHPSIKSSMVNLFKLRKGETKWQQVKS